MHNRSELYYPVMLYTLVTLLRMEVQRGVENVELYFGGNNHVVRPTVRMSCYLSIC